jgi:AcrR family transcriptional regulator
VAARRRLTAPQRRAALLDAALEVFARRGYHGASVDEIAQEAGVSKALVYEHFASKRDLHDELLSEHAGELFSRLRANALAGTTGAERLRGGIDAFFGWVEDHRVAWRALFRDQADPELAPVVNRLQSQAVSVMGAIAAEDPEAPEPVEAHARALSGAVQGMANWWDEHPDIPRERLVDAVMEFCWLGLERYRTGERLEEASDPPR